MHDVILADSAASLAGALEKVLGSVAVDTEFHAERRYHPKLMLVQLQGAEGPAVLVDPRAVADLGPLGRALRGRRLILHAPSVDLFLLRQAAGLDLAAVELVDVQVLAGFTGLGYPRSLTTLTLEVLGHGRQAPASLSDWSQRPLSAEQRAYAAEDVRWLHRLEAELSARLGAARLPAALACCREVAEEALRPPDPATMARSIPAARVLDPRELDLLVRLVAWREDRAREENTPRLQVLGNATLVDVARRRPHTVEALADNRLFPRSAVKRYGEALVREVERSRHTPWEALPAPEPTGVKADGARALLRAWSFAMEAETGISATLVLPESLERSLVDAFTLGRPAPGLGWRETVLPADPWSILRGAGAVAMGPAGPVVRFVTAAKESPNDS